jgi:hypothetical protein
VLYYIGLAYGVLMAAENIVINLACSTPIRTYIVLLFQLIIAYYF